MWNNIPYLPYPHSHFLWPRQDAALSWASAKAPEEDIYVAIKILYRIVIFHLSKLQLTTTKTISYSYQPIKPTLSLR